MAKMDKKKLEKWLRWYDLVFIMIFGVIGLHISFFSYIYSINFLKYLDFQIVSINDMRLFFCWFVPSAVTVGTIWIVKTWVKKVVTNNRSEKGYGY